jgi:hypothetical protein
VPNLNSNQEGSLIEFDLIGLEAEVFWVLEEICVAIVYSFQV